ncbi:MAG: hypothetical protein EB060_04995 [Proteobacteria bacterium]|nr:hypothetical protein [Pseudomonadota bacterium]
MEIEKLALLKSYTEGRLSWREAALSLEVDGYEALMELMETMGLTCRMPQKASSSWANLVAKK